MLPASIFNLCFRCQLCQEEKGFPDAIRVYNVPGWIPVIPRPAWCWSCNDLVQAEYIPTPGEILADARAHLRRDRNHPYLYIYHGIFEGWDDERDLNLYDNAFRWRRWRRSRERCLECESELVSLVAAPGSRPFEHPGCGGFFHCTGLTNGHAGHRELYSSEGFLLQRDWTFGSCAHLVPLEFPWIR